MMSGPMMQGMMKGMMQTMHGMMGMTQGQMQPGQMQPGQMQPGGMRSEERPPQARDGMMMNCPMMSDTAQTSAPAMMQMMQGMMQMMQDDAGSDAAGAKALRDFGWRKLRAKEGRIASRQSSTPFKYRLKAGE